MLNITQIVSLFFFFFQLVPEESLPFTPFFTLLEIKRQQKQMENKTDMQLEKSSLAGCKTQDTLAIKEVYITFILS